MLIKNYSSKKIGVVEVRNEANQYTICSARLALRSFNQNEEPFLIEQYAALLGSSKNVALFGEGKPWTLTQVTEFVHGEIKKWNDNQKFAVFTIFNKETNEFMGCLNIDHSVAGFAKVGAGHENVAEIGYIIDQAFWGKGYGTEIAILGKKYIKHIVTEAPTDSLEGSIREIVATVHPDNIGSKKILEKTLKRQEEEEFVKFGGKRRFLFFKPFAVSNVAEVEPMPYALIN
jgi:RimJ/RimL family protein N-acetyltransferase